MTTTASGGERRAEAERDRHGDEEEREPRVRVRAAGQDREHADRDDVDAGRDEREPLAGAAGGRPTRARRRSRPRTGRASTRNHVRCSVRVPMLSPRAISAIAGSRSHATARSASAVASPDDAGRVGRSTALLDQPSPHRARHCGGAIRDPELLVQVLDVGLHGGQARGRAPSRSGGGSCPRRSGAGSPALAGSARARRSACGAGSRRRGRPRRPAARRSRRGHRRAPRRRSAHVAPPSRRSRRRRSRARW